MILVFLTALVGLQPARPVHAATCITPISISASSDDATEGGTSHTMSRTETSLTICYRSATPIVTTTGTLSAFNSGVGTPSAEQSYTVSGTNLTDNLMVTAPTDFQVSTTSGSYSRNTLSLTPSGGTVASTTIYVRINPTSATTYSANITNASSGATAQNVAVSGSSVPIITASSTKTFFPAPIGAYSAEQSYSVSGINLTGDITIVPPANFEVSTTGGGIGFVDSSGAPQESASVSGTATNENMAPNAPVLVQPTNNATDVIQPVTLKVTASDPNPADTLNVTFYGRAVGGGSAGADFSMVVLPDIQNESQYNTAMLSSQMNWMVSNATDDNIVFATSVGDLVNTPTDTTQYGNADARFDILDTGNVPNSAGPGNHDLYVGTLWANYFGTSRWSSRSYYGGAYDDFSHYFLFSASGMDFILINLQYQPTTDQINWANNLLQTYSSRRAIVEQHDILNTDNSWYNQTSYNTLRSNANLFLMLCGHMHSTSDGAAYAAETGTDGHTIHVVMQDYQDFSNGNGWLRIYRFSPANNKIYMTTYSPYTDANITTSPDQMDLAYSMASSGPFPVIGTTTGITNGADASLTWTGLTAGTKYEWYAVVSDGNLSTTGDRWNFTPSSTTNHTVFLPLIFR